jgi:hypothetical protein
MMKRRSNEEIARDIIAEIEDAGGAIKVTGPEMCGLLKQAAEMARQPRFPGYRKENAKHAAQMLKWIEEGEKLLGAAPDLFVRLYKPLDAMTSNLGYMRSLCEFIIREKPGEHGGSGRHQWIAAAAARALLTYYKLPIVYSSANSRFRAVARLYYEAIADRPLKDDEDIERACRAVARSEELKKTFVMPEPSGTER